MTRALGIWAVVCLPLTLWAQGDKDLRAKADALFLQGNYAEAMPLYSQLVSLTPGDPDLNYKFGACSLYGGEDKEKAIGFLKFATQRPETPALAWYFLGKAQHLTYHFKEALAAYDHYRGTADKRTLAEHPVDALEQQCRNGQNLLSNLKDIDVHNKVEVDAAEFFRFYDLSDIGGRIVVTPDELKTSLDKKSKERSLVYLPGNGGPIYFSSLGKDGKTGRDIYRTQLMPTGEFATPVKVAGYINTDQDEDYACMSADGHTLYFCSKGHNSMGGYDVFKSLYDPANDVFGAPENMDFAVNTPDDDMLYLVDPQGKEACFASARDSKQGMVHVYRVSTTQVPVNITVLKGTFASQFDAQDRKAHIVVEDAVSREQVADVRTDINGSYVLAIPRSGKYKFMVEAGPSGRTHVGLVEIPRNTEAKAYRQEMMLIDQGGEKLMIKNYFDEPLQDDIIDLALAEIKRRAHLDMSTTAKPPVAEPAPEPTPGDVITQAGFPGDVTKESAQQMAATDATELESASKAYGDQATAAYALAEANVQEADAAIAEAKRLVAQAEALADEAQKNDLMTQAARARQRSREADLRARSAYRTGQDLDTERMATQQKAVTARTVSNDLTAALSTKNDAAALTALQQLKKRMDEKNGPDNVDLAERMRRAATAAQKEAAEKLQLADAQRAEESELQGRISSLEREQAKASGKRKEDLGKQLAELKEQDTYLQQEVATAFAKAKRAEQDAAVSNGGPSLVQRLATNTATGGAPMTTAAITDLGQRVSGTEARIAAVGVDERYIDAIAAETQASEQQAFDWRTHDPANAATASAAQPTATGDANGQATHMNGNTVALHTEDQGTGTLRTTDAVPDGAGANAQPADGASAANNGAANSANGADGALAASTNEPHAAQASGDHPAVNATDATSNTAQATNAAGTTGDNGSAANTNAAGQQQAGQEQGDAHAAGNAADRTAQAANNGTDQRAGNANDNGQAGQPGGNAARASDGTQHANDLASMHGVGDPTEPAGNGAAAANNTGAPVTGGNTSGTQAPGTVGGSMGEAPTPEEEAFVLANELAELRQMRAAEKDKVQQDSLDARIARTRQRMRDTQRPATAQHADGTRTAEANGRTDAAGAHTAGQATDTAAAANDAAVDTAASGEENVLVLDSDAVHGPPMAFDTAMAEAQLVDRLFATFAQDRARIQADEGDVRERAQELHGLELMLVDSIDAETARQTASLEASNEKALVLARMDRLRQLKEAHLKEADRVLADAEQQYAAMESRRLEDAAIAAANAGGTEKPVTGGDQGGPPTPHNDSYVTIAHGSEHVYESVMDHRSHKVEEAVKQKDQDIGQLNAYEETIDSLETMLEGMAGGKAWDKLRAEADRAIDDHLILRTEMGQRMAFITHAEYDAAKDSADALRGLVAKKGLSPGEPEVQMAQRLRDDARTAMDMAAARRKEADRSSDIVLRDSLYRQAYGMELQALRDMDRALTVQNHVLSDGYKAGAAPSYAQIEEAMFGKPSAVAWDRSGGQAAGTAGPDSSALAAAQQRRPDYKTYLRPDGKPIPAPEGADSSSLVLPAQQQAAAARSLEQRSVDTADRANALQDSAATAQRNNDREAIEREAARLRHIADSLHTAALAGQNSALAQEQKERDEADRKAFRERLSKYYYLSNEEQGMVMNAEDESRYFNITAKALEQQAQASADRADAENDRKLATALSDQATALRADSAAQGQAERTEQAAQLDVRSAQLRSRADSLAAHADLLDRAATVNGSQAAVVLQGLPAERSSAIMAKEQHARRTEPTLAEARAAQPPASTAEHTTTTAAAPAHNGNNEQPRAATRTIEAPARPAAADPAATTAATGTNASAATPNGLPATLPALTGDVFSMDAAAPRQGAIPIDAPMPAGVVFKVQVGAFKHAVSDQAFNDMTPVTGETVGNGLTRYTAGMFTNAASAVTASEQVRARGYRDAFVVAYQDGKRIPVSKAMALVSGAQPVVAERPATPVQQPSTLPPVEAGADDAAVLTKYAASAQEVLAAFKPAPEATAYYNDPTAAPANQVEAIKGLFFTVQVGVYSKPTALDKLFNITPLNSERTENNKIRYTTGVFLDLPSASTRKDATVGLGVKDAFVTAYLNGKRIPMRDARALLTKFGNTILADPSTLKR